MTTKLTANISSFGRENNRENRNFMRAADNDRDNGRSDTRARTIPFSNQFIAGITLLTAASDLQ
jgi:hypothetical protein